MIKQPLYQPFIKEGQLSTTRKCKRSSPENVLSSKTKTTPD